jgi:MFS family permease
MSLPLPVSTPSRQKQTFALRSHTFRVFIGGSIVSRVGDWMDLVALNWAVLGLTHSPVYLGVINACRLVPAFLLSVPAGILADRHDRRKLLLWLQIATILFTVALAACLEVGSAFWLFATLVTFRSIFTAMDPPVRNAFLSNMVEKECLSSAIAIQTSVLNISRILGPAIAGFLLGRLEIASLFWINAVCGFGVLISLWIVRPIQSQDINRKTKVKGDVGEAIAYIRTNPSVRSLLLLAVVPMLFGFPYTSLLPLFSKELLGTGPEGFGLLLSVSACGALLGSFWLSVRSTQSGTGKWLIGSIIAFGIGLWGFVLAPYLIVAAAAMFFVGLTSQVYRTMSRITLQMEVPDRLRGRLLSIALMDRGFIPLGSVLLGMFASWGGAFWTGIVMGGGCIAITLAVLAVRRQIWHL